MQYPDKRQQIIATHAAFIRQVVEFLGGSDRRAELEALLNNAEQNGWQALSRAVRAIAAGQRDPLALGALDEEDGVIADAILRGLQDPTTLPDPARNSDPAMAAPGLAHMIHAAGRGDAQALQAAAFMAEQMINTQGDMRLLGGQIKRLLDGERDADVLCKGMGPSGEQLVLNLLDELSKLAEH